MSHMKKYRARLSNGRVVGPFDLKGLEELAIKNHIDGSEDFQEFPIGDWLPLSQFPEAEKLVIEAINKGSLRDQQENEATFVKKLSDFTEEKERDTELFAAENSFPDEFKYEPGKGDLFQPETVDDSILPKKDLEDELENDQELEEDEAEEEEELPTELYTKYEYKQEENEDKTIISSDTLKYLEEEKKRKQAELELAQAEAEKEEPAEVDLEEDATQFVNLQDLKEEVATDAENAEFELHKEAIAEEKNAKMRKLSQEKEKKKRELEQQSTENEDDETDNAKAKKKKAILVFIIAIFVITFILPEEKEEKKIKPVSIIYPEITFPQQYEEPNAQKAQALFKEGILKYTEETYKAKIDAAKYLRASLENKFRDNDATGKLIFAYSELLPHSNSKLADANRVFKLIQIFNKKMAKDPNVAAGIGLFYFSMEKYSAAIKVIEKFNTIRGSKPTPELFAVYLMSLQENGNLVKAKAVEQKLAALQNKSVFVNSALFDYYVFKGNYEAAAATLLVTEEKAPKSVATLLRKAELFLYKEDFDSIGELLKTIRAMEAGNSKIYYAKFLELRALLSAHAKKPEQALKDFKRALELNESLELRSRLASLGASEGEAGILINQSKAVKLIARSKNHWKKDNRNFAFKDALEATRIAPDYLPAQLYLAELQIKQSYFEESIKTLEGLYKKFPEEEKVAFGLIDAYIEAYKLEKAQKLLAILGGSEMRLNPDYYSKMAKYYIYKDEFNAAVAWLQKAININPLNDENVFALANMFIRYKKFNQAKVLLNKAMDLDPSRVDFRVSYADIIYETDGANQAIGYLIDVLRDFPDNARILSSIGIYYYRSGQIKMFQATKDQLLALPDKDTALFEFLIKASKLDEKYDDVVKYSEELIQLNPGDLRARLFLGQVYMETSKYKEALEQFNAIKERLETYPKLQYYMSKLYLLTENTEKAMELARKEIEGNPAGVDGYVMLADILKSKEEYNEAEKQYKKAQKIAPKNVDVLVGLAYINFMKSQYEIALDLFKKAKAFEPGRAETHKLLGDVYRKIGQSALAVESYKLFLELSPNTRYKQNLQNYINMMQ